MFVLRFNFDMHVRLVGGADSDDPTCLYKAYEAADSTLRTFETNLKKAALPKWFWIGHIIGAGCFISGILLLLTGL
jgi:hypothetical protein